MDIISLILTIFHVIFYCLSWKNIKKLLSTAVVMVTKWCRAPSGWCHWFLVSDRLQFGAGTKLMLPTEKLALLHWKLSECFQKVLWLTAITETCMCSSGTITAVQSIQDTNMICIHLTWAFSLSINSSTGFFSWTCKISKYSQMNLNEVVPSMYA